MQDLVIDLIDDLVVSLELIKVNLEVVRRLDVGQYQRIEVHGTLVAPERQNIGLLCVLRAALALLLAAARVVPWRAWKSTAIGV